MKSLTITLLVATLAGTTAAQTVTAFNQHSKAARFRRANETSEKASPSARPATSKVDTTTKKPTTSGSGLVSAAHTSGTGNADGPAISSQIYRVGVRDVLDIQLPDNPGGGSTLFTVLEGGLLDYPFVGSPVSVSGLTTQEIATLLRQRIKIFDNPNVLVKVRDFASHTVNVSGFVAAPGTKTLRREAVPLYTILAESLVLPEAARATIIREGRAPFTVDLKNANVVATLIVAGDAVKVSGNPSASTEFFFIGGEIKSPGQKAYYQGLTLTQAILASGGTTASAGASVRVARQGTDGKLMTAEYNLRNIQAGKLPDPVMQKGDRIEVTSVK